MFFLTACGVAPARPTFTAGSPPSPLPEKTGLRVAVASDIHLNPDGGSGEGAAANYSTELVDALLWDAEDGGEVDMWTDFMAAFDKALHELEGGD